MEIVDSMQFEHWPKIECGSSRGRRGSAGMIDPTQPSPQARAQVSNKNNLADLSLRHTLAVVERQKSAKMNTLNYERLEVLNLLHDIKKRDSDKDPIYLKHFRDMTLSGRMAMSAPPGQRVDLESRGKQRLHRRRRERTKKDSVPNEQDVMEAKIVHYHLEQTDGHNTAADAHSVAKESGGHENQTSDGVTQHRAHFADETNADPNQAVMREIMEDKMKPKRKEPLEKRITAFLENVEAIKKARKEAEVAYLKSDRMKRNWILMTKGIDAALAESSDEDDDFGLHTI